MATRLLIGEFGAVWRLRLDGAPQALSTEGRYGQGELDPSRQRFAFVDRDGQLHVLDIVRGALRSLPGNDRNLAVCGWFASPDSIVLRTLATPLRLVRIDPATGAQTPYMEITPPPLGLRAVMTFGETST